MHFFKICVCVHAQINWAFWSLHEGGLRVTFAWGVAWGSCLKVRVVSKLRGLELCNSTKDQIKVNCSDNNYKSVTNINAIV